MPLSLVVFGSVVIVSLISLVGIFALLMSKEFLQKILFFLISLAAGGLLGDVFLHIVPESIESETFSEFSALFILGGMLIFFILEKLIHWRHCRAQSSPSHPHTLAFMNLIGDGLHNFIDGLFIAGSYFISMPLGITTTLAVILHEIPQEIGDFGVLVHSGLSRSRALMWNFLSALLAVAGAAVGLALGANPSFTELLLPFTAGGFLYIAASDLIPELHKETTPWKSVVQFIGMLLGIGAMYLLTFLE